MKKGTVLPVLFMIIVLVGVFSYKGILPHLKNKQQKQTSDSKDLKGEISLAIDNWIGYFPVSSSRMKKYLRSEGYGLKVTDDGADYASRMKNLKDRKYDFVVATVDSDILNSAPLDFPGTIMMVIDESKGADAMVAYTNVVSSLDSFKENLQVKIGFTAGSPSHHLVKIVASHFSVPGLKKLDGAHKVETKDSDEAFKLFREKKVQVAVLWEPNVSRALKLPGVGKIIGSESISRGIVDVLMVNREFALKYPEKVNLFLRTYFRVLKFYADNPEDLKKDIHSELKIPVDSIPQMLDGVRWVNLTENCQEWFGVGGPGQTSEQGLVDTIESTVSILIESGDFKENPLPDKDPYRIINSSFVSSIYKDGVKTGFASLETGATGAVVGIGLDRPFKQLTDAQWDRLRSVGSIRVDPIMFQSGLADLTISEKEKLDLAVSRLKHYPTFRIKVSGHTSSSGDPEANVELSQARADSVARYLMITYSVDQNRIRSVGFGGSRPLSKLPDESDRAYGYRLPRVELCLFAETF
ncbi:MAG: OmpA family protein [Candidatus Paceibacterota bacterium]|jgi:outer membrane protein OmpA-like peptidoglycan-associated protein